MADDQVVTNIVARADFSDLIANVRKVTTTLAAMQQQIGSSNKVLSAQINALNRSFGDTLRSTGQFSTHFVSLNNDVETFGKRLDGGKLKLRDYFSTLQTHTRTSGGLIRDLARQQVQLQNAILQPLGKNAQGLMQFNVHIPQGLDKIKHSGALARQEMQILNRVMQEGAGQLINWGKNTQWAGRQLTVGLTVPIAAFGAAAAKAFREADQELTRLTKVYGGLGATSSAELQKVRRDVTAVANELARGYGASFKETLALSADIAATGKEGAELLGSIKETTRLAVLGEVDRQDAMKATLAIQSAFKQDTDELAESINFLNAVENQTSTTLNDLVEAIPKAGPVIKGLGGDVQDLALYLTAMREGGINASEGANALKSALASLINPTDVAVKKFEGFGIDLMGIVNNNAGDVTKTLFALQSALDNLNPLQKSQAIEQLFGKFQFARLSALFENLGKQGSQTLQVMDLMKASSKELATIASRELSMVTESASGKYKRAVEGLKADLAGIGEEFLKVSTFFINLVDGIVKFINNLPGPIKTILTFLAGLTAVTGPLIMLTGVLANFLGYVIKGAFHLKALFKGGEGWRMLTPEILAANQAGSLIEKTFYSDAKAALALAEALQVLSAGMTSIQSKMNQGVISVQPMLSTVAGTVIRPPDDGGGGGGGIARVVDPRNPLVGPAGTRASAHMVPRSGMSAEERAAQTIHSFLPAPIPVNQAIGANPQIFAAGDLPAVPGLTTITGRSGAVSTGVVSSEAAKWHAMVGALSMMTKQEVAQMKTQLSTTGTVSSEFTQAFGSLLPQMSSIADSAARQSAVIVAQAKAGTISVETARQRIIQLNLQVEQLMAQATTGTATSLGRTAVITGVPTLDQPVVDPKTGKSNMRELFKKTGTRSFVDDLARLMGVRTWGAGYSTHTTIPIRRNMGGKVYNPDVHGNVVPGDTSINYDNTPAVLREGGFILNQSSSRINPDLVNLAKNSKNTGGKIVPAILTPGETYFPPEIAQEIMPTLEQANSGSVIKLLNAGGILGGRVSNKKLNYGIRISPIDILSKLGRWNPNMVGGARRVYDTRSSGSRASNSPRTFGQRSEFGPETYHSLFRRSSGTWGVHGGVLRHGERTSDEVLGHVITSKFLKQFKGLPEQGSSRVLTGSQFESRFGLMPGGATSSKVYQVLPDNLITITKDFNAALLNGNATGAMWLASNRQPQHFISLLSHLLNSGVPYKVAYRVAGRTLERINKAMFRLKDTSLTETKWGNIVDSSMQAEISALSRSYTKGSMHSLNAGGIVPGGRVSRNRFGYGIPALAASAISRLTSRWKTPNPYSPLTQKHDWTNTDPLHGPLFIGKADIGSEGVRRSLSYNLALPDGRRQLVGISPMMSNDPRYLIERYMAGDKAVLARMQYEGGKGLNPHPLSIQSLFRLLARPFRGTLYRGMTSQSVSDTLPKHIVDAIEKARATGDFSALIGKDFIMRRASFTADPKVASFFAPGSGSGSLVLQAQLFGRKVTPTSEIFPDKKFQAPYGQDWSGGMSSRRYRSEQESLVGGRFIITGFDGKKLIVEGRAMGGPVSGATPYIVGEKGPELFVPKNSGGIIPNYALGGVVKGGKINYGELPPGWAQSLAQPTLAAQMRASGELPPIQTPQPLASSKGGAKFGLGAANIGGNILGFMGGSALGSKLSDGNMLVSTIAGVVGSSAVSAGLTKLITSMTSLGTATGAAAGKTSLLTKAFQFFIKLPGPLKLLAAVVGVGLAIETMNNKISEHRRIVNSGFGITEKSAEKLGLSYKKLGSEIDEYQKKYDLMMAKAAANRYNSTKAEGQGIDITVPELEKLKKEVAKNFPDEIKMFNTANNDEAVERATNLKAGMVAMGKSVEEANEVILAMLMNSNKASIALEVLGDVGFGNIRGKISATNSTVRTFANVIKEGNFDQLPIALTTAVNALDQLQKSFVKTGKNAKDTVTSSEAFVKVLNQIGNSTAANKEIGEKGLEEILAQNEGLRDVISSTDTLAGIWAKIKLSTSGINFNLKDMASSTATAIAEVLAKQKDYLATNNDSIKAAADLIARTGNQTSAQIIKNANRTKESIQNEIKLRQKNIENIKAEADAKKKALEEELQAEDFLTQLQKKQVEYSEALASGDMASAAQAQLDIQSMTGSRQLDLAKSAIDNKANADIKKQQDAIEKLSISLDNLSKATEKSIAAAEQGQVNKAQQQSLMDSFYQALGMAQDGITSDESDAIKMIGNQLRNSGIPEFKNLAEKYFGLVPTGPYVGSQQSLGYGNLISLAGSSLSFVKGSLKVTDVELLNAINNLELGNTTESTVTFTPIAQTERSAMGTKTVYTITPQQYVDSGMYVEGESPQNKTFVDVYGKRYKISGIQSDGDYIVTPVQNKAMGGVIKNFMPGGNVTGPGTGTSDSIPAMLSNGEYVIKANSVKKYGIDTFDALNAGRFADGGPVNTSALITPSVPYYMNMGGMIPGYHQGEKAGQQLPFFPWRSDLPNYWSNGKPTGNPRTGRWGELRYNPSPGHDIWGGTEIPGLKFTGKTPQQSDYWHQMQEQPKKSTGLGMGVDKDPMLLAGSGASTGGIGMGAYGLGPLMLAGGGSVIKTALGWITKNLSKFKLPSFRVAKNTGRTVKPENIETFLSSVLGDVKLPAIKTDALPPNHAGQYIPRFGDESGTNLMPYILLQSRIKTSGNTAVHETMHHFDVDVLHDSFKKTLTRLRESGKTDLADEYESIFVTGENKQKGFGYESWAQKALDLEDYDSIAYFGGTAEAFAEESTFKAYQKFITSKSPKDKKLALTIGNPYGPGFSTDILRGYFKSYKEYQRNALATPIRLNPLFLKGLVENSPNMPEKTKNIYSMWAEGLEKFRPPARKNQDEILNSLQFQQFKQYIIDNNLDRAKGFHDGGPVGHKHPSTSYSPAPMSAAAKEIMALSIKLMSSGAHLPRLANPTLPASTFNIPLSAGSTATMFTPATGKAGDPKFTADSQEAADFSRSLGAMLNFALTPLTPSKAPDVSKQTEKSKYMREQMAIAWDMMHKVNPAFKLGSWLVKPMFDAATNIGAGDGKWNDYTSIAANFVGSGLYKNAAKGAFGGIKALSSKAPALLKNFGSSTAGKLVPVPKTTVHAQMPGPKKLSEDTLRSIKEAEDQLAKTMQEIDDLRSGAYYEKNTWADPAYKDSSIEHLEASAATTIERIERAKKTDVPPGFFGALDLYIQKPIYAQGSDFDIIASATSRSSAFTTLPFYRALSHKDMAEIVGWSTRPNIADMTLGLPWMKQHGKSLLEETPWGSLYGSRWRPGVTEEIPPGATRHPDVPAHVPDSALYGGLPGRLSPESWQFLEKDPALKIGESWIPPMHKSITDSLDFAKEIAVNGGTGGGGAQAIARFEFTPESKGILDLRGTAVGAGWYKDPNTGEGLIAPWTEYVLKAINKNKYNYSVPGFDGAPSTHSKLIDEYVFTVLGQHIPPGWTPFYKAMGGLVSQHDIPKFEKGINMVPANMLAMLHKNEAVIPANMNPFNPNAQTYSQPSVSYNIAPVINAAPGMDEQAIANMATRQVLAEMKIIDARNNASMGRPGMRVVGK
jgi:TP901 family phage tail tape measure protein